MSISKEDILHLASLSRIRLTDEEVEHFSGEIDSILEYVGAVQKIAGDSEVGVIKGNHFNIFRKDEVTNQPDEYTEALLKEMPETDGRYMKVKKILSQDE